MSYEVKYAPKTLDDVVISDPNIYKVLNEYIKYGNKKPLLIYGSYGLGKSSVAR
jgi:replication-associated recombination protein RarA